MTERHSWIWGALLGLGMICAGIGGAAVALGPVLLWYDRDYLGLTAAELPHVSHQLIHFIQHDRLTLAGIVGCIGILYVGLSVGGIRHGQAWATRALLISGAVGFPTLFYFLGFGFFEPLHAGATAVLFPLFVAAVWPRDRHAKWRLLPAIPRSRAGCAQLMLIGVCGGILVAGTVISIVGLTSVFVPSDLVFLGTTEHRIAMANDRLITFIAHDRAGFGGALLSAAVGIGLLAAWGWRAGARWVWWTMAGVALAGFAPVLTIHWTIGYTDFLHLGPVYLAAAVTAVALAIAWPFLHAKT